MWNSVKCYMKTLIQLILLLYRDNLSVARGEKLGNSLTEVESLLTSIINIFIHNMFENRSDISMNENKSEMAIPAERSSLPFIHDKLISRGELTKSIHLPKK